MEIMVSILTTAYNHAPYIAQALDSFLMQKTDFPFEVIVHDDASTDGTADIIRGYAEKYPDIIKPIFQTQNQFSKGISPYYFMTPFIKGKYCAQCEGDDYWCDEDKLQKQVDYMELHPETSFCFCNSYDVNVDGEIIGTKESVVSDRVFNTEEIINSDGAFMATAGILVRSDLAGGFEQSGLIGGEVGDLPFRCYLALQGTVYGFADKMVCYRRFVPGSWTMRVEKGHFASRRVRRCQEMVNFYSQLDELSQKKYHEVITNKKRRWKFNVLLESYNRKALLSPEYKENYKKIPIKMRAIIYTKSTFPLLIRIFRLFRYGRESFYWEI